MTVLASFASDWNSANPPPWLLTGAPLAACVLLGGAALLAVRVLGHRQQRAERGAPGDRPMPGMSVPEPHDPDFVKEER